MIIAQGDKLYKVNDPDALINNIQVDTLLQLLSGSYRQLRILNNIVTVINEGLVEKTPEENFNEEEIKSKANELMEGVKFLYRKATEKTSMEMVQHQIMNVDYHFNDQFFIYPDNESK